MKSAALPFSGWGLFVLEGQLSIGQLIAFRIISGNVVGPIIRLAGTGKRFSLRRFLSSVLPMLMHKQSSRGCSTHCLATHQRKG